jgi:hypothetical protein
MSVWIALALAIGCTEIKSESEDSAGFERQEEYSEEDEDQDSEDSDSDGEGFSPEEVTGTITGTVDIQLFTEGEDGERETISWEDAYEGVYPFGKIFVAAYYEDANTGASRYVGSDVIENPQPTGNQYSIDVSIFQPKDVRVYGILDYYIDDITGTDEPMGGYNRVIPFEGGDIDEIDFSILSPLKQDRPPCESLGDITITGEATITKTYTGGDVAAMLMEPGVVGPVHSAVTSPEIQGGGGAGDYVLQSCQNLGYMLLIGIWDNNQNGMFDPTDESGPYISAPNQNGNPVSIYYSQLSDYEIQIPLNSGSGLSLVPFVQLSGVVDAGFGNVFGDISDGGTLYVTALKYRPDLDLSVTYIQDESYDFQSFTWAELQGAEEVEWELTVPNETITYLWAYLDHNDNGVVQEPGEAVSNGGEDENGKFPTGNSSTDNIRISLIVFN